MNSSGSRVAGRERGLRHASELVADLDSRVAPAHDDHALANVGLGVAVVGDVPHRAGEVLLSWQLGRVGVGERARRRDDCRGIEPVARRRVDGETGTRRRNGYHTGVRTDLDVEARRIALEVAGDLVAWGMVVGISWERHARERAEPDGGEQPEAVVVVGPGTGGTFAGLQHDRAQADGGRGAGCGEA
jgi:hypothetical protein